MSILLGLLVLLLVSRVDSYRVQISAAAVKSGKISNANAIKYVRYSRLYDNNKGIFTIIISNYHIHVSMIFTSYYNKHIINC